MSMLGEFFTKTAVFTVAELDQFLKAHNSRNRNTRNALLAYHKKKGRIVSIRRGLFGVVPLWSSNSSFQFDPYLLAAKMTNDAVLAYHTALEFHGKAYSVFERFYYLSNRGSLPVNFRSHEFKCLRYPKALRDKGKEKFDVLESEQEGVKILVTSLERTLVDMLDKLELSGGWEEVWRSLESVEYFNLEKIFTYTLHLGNSTTSAKVGFFLQRNRERLMVEEEHLDFLKKQRPKSPHYFSRSNRSNGRFVSEWNLVVPGAILEKPSVY